MTGYGVLLDLTKNTRKRLAQTRISVVWPPKKLGVTWPWPRSLFEKFLRDDVRVYIPGNMLVKFEVRLWMYSVSSLRTDTCTHAVDVDVLSELITPHHRLCSPMTNRPIVEQDGFWGEFLSMTVHHSLRYSPVAQRYLDNTRRHNRRHDCFKHSLKTFLFSGYWRTERSRGDYDSALYKCTFTLLTYLLTYWNTADWRYRECGLWLSATEHSVRPCGRFQTLEQPAQRRRRLSTGNYSTFIASTVGKLMLSSYWDCIIVVTGSSSYLLCLLTIYWNHDVGVLLLNWLSLLYFTIRCL